MGWGVEEHESFPSLIEQELQRKTLNAGISSFGTVREINMLSTLDLSALQVLVIQYHENDLRENQSFSSNDFVLPIMSAEVYRNRVKKHAQTKEYYPGKYLRLFLPALVYSVTNSLLLEERPAGEAATFLDVIRRTPVDLEGVQIVVFEIASSNQNSDRFVRSIEQEIAQRAYPSYVEKIQTLDLTSHLTEHDYFRYDDHIRAEGHKVVARELGALIQALGAATDGDRSASSVGR